MEAAFHTPVLLDEVLKYLLTDVTRTYVDATAGGGGHASSICERLSGRGMLICFDADADALDVCRKRMAGYGERVCFVHANFKELAVNLRSLGVERIQGVLMDLGVSSYQLDEGTKGFSFRTDERIDMRMDRRQRLTGWDVVNTYEVDVLADVLWKYGEERNSRRIARTISAARPVETTGALRDVIASAVGNRFLTKTLARIFQAIRIEVNNELESLERALQDTLEVLEPGGRIVAIAYHSLEDRIVKEFFKQHAAERIPSGIKLIPDTLVRPKLGILTPKPVTAAEMEIRRNPRARSAKLRAAERLPG